MIVPPEGIKIHDYYFDLREARECDQGGEAIQLIMYAALLCADGPYGGYGACGRW